MRLTNIVAWWPGSTHDSFVLTNSSVGNRLEAGRMCDGWLIGKQLKHFKANWRKSRHVDHAKKEPIPHHSGHPLLKWGELPGSAARLTHASPVGRNLSFYVDLYVRPLFFNVRHSSAFRPNVVYRVSKLVLVLVLIPEQREPNKMLFLASTSEISTSTSHSLKFFFSSFLHYLLSHNKRTTAGLFIRISILNEGGVRAESRARARALNFTLIGMYKENLREIVLTQGLIHPDLFVRSSFPDCGVRKVLVRNPRKSLYMRPLEFRTFSAKGKGCLTEYSNTCTDQDQKESTHLTCPKVPSLVACQF